MHEVRAEDGDILLEPCQYGLADAKRLQGFFVGAGEKVLVVRRRAAKNIVKTMEKGKMHGRNPFQIQSKLDAQSTWGRCAGLQQDKAVLLNCLADMALLVGIHARLVVWQTKYGRE
jgi:hypothetical protein